MKLEVTRSNPYIDSTPETKIYILYLFSGCLQFIVVGIYSELVVGAGSYQHEYRNFNLCCVFVILSGVCYVLPVLATCYRTFCSRPTYHNNPSENLCKRIILKLKSYSSANVIFYLCLVIVLVSQIIVIYLPNWSDAIFIKTQNETGSLGLWEGSFKDGGNKLCYIQIEDLSDEIHGMFKS